MVQRASVAARTRGILRRCAPQDDNLFVILSGTEWSEESRACAVPYRTHPSGVAASFPKVRAKRARTGAQCAPLWGGSHSPPCCFGKWVAAVLRDNAFTREARPEGKGVDSQEGENRRCSPSCAQCGRAGRVPARDARALSQRLSRRTRTRGREILRFAQDDRENVRMTKKMSGRQKGTGAAQRVAVTLYKDLSVSPLTRRSTSPQRGGRLGGADGSGNVYIIYRVQTCTSA